MNRASDRNHRWLNNFSYYHPLQNLEMMSTLSVIWLHDRNAILSICSAQENLKNTDQICSFENDSSHFSLRLFLIISFNHDTFNFYHQKLYLRSQLYFLKEEKYKTLFVTERKYFLRKEVHRFLAGWIHHSIDWMGLIKFYVGRSLCTNPCPVCRN